MIDLVCPVRACRKPLTRGRKQWSCPRGHSFDLARSGYCNLLQPSERRSKTPGDSIEAASARRRLFDRGIGSRLLDDVWSLVGELFATGPVLDAGCGEGFHLARLSAHLGACGVGIDISAPSIDLAARRYREHTWIVSNVDHQIPLADHSAGVILSITSRVNRAEFARTLRDDGLVVVVVPGHDDLAELRRAVLGDAASLTRMPDIDPATDPVFELVRQVDTRETFEADTETIADLLLSTYRGQRRSQGGAAAELSGLTVTQSRSAFVHRRRRG